MENGRATNEYVAILAAIQSVQTEVTNLRNDMREDVRLLHERVESFAKAAHDHADDVHGKSVSWRFCDTECRPYRVDRRFFLGIGGGIVFIGGLISYISSSVAMQQQLARLAAGG